MNFKNISIAFFAFLLLSASGFAGEAKLRTVKIPLPAAGSGCWQKMVITDQNGDGVYDYIKNWCYNEIGICYRHFEGKITKYEIPTDSCAAKDSLENIELITNYVCDSNFVAVMTKNISKTLLSSYFNVCEYNFYRSEGDSVPLFTLFCNKAGQWSFRRNCEEKQQLSDLMIEREIINHFTPTATNAYTFDDLSENYDEGTIISGKNFNIKLGAYVALITTKYEIMDKTQNVVLTAETKGAKEISFDISALAAGTYYLRQYFTNSETATIKIVKN